MFLQSVETKMDTTSGRNSNLLIILKTPSSQRSTGLVSSRSGDSYHQRDREMSPLMEKRLQKMSPTVTRGIHNNAKRKETDKQTDRPANVSGYQGQVGLRGRCGRAPSYKSPIQEMLMFLKSPCIVLLLVVRCTLLSSHSAAQRHYCGQIGQV